MQILDNVATLLPTKWNVTEVGDLADRNKFAGIALLIKPRFVKRGEFGLVIIPQLYARVGGRNLYIGETSAENCLRTGKVLRDDYGLTVVCGGFDAERNEFITSKGTVEEFVERNGYNVRNNVMVAFDNLQKKSAVSKK